MPDTQQELESLKAQIEQLQRERNVTVAQTAGTDIAEEPGGGEELPDWLVELLDADGQLDAQTLLARLRELGGEWLEGFNEDIQEVKPSTVLAIFALGVLVGRLR